MKRVEKKMKGKDRGGWGGSIVLKTAIQIQGDVFFSNI